MREIRTSGSMSGDGKRGVCEPPPRPSPTLLKRKVVSRWQVAGGEEPQPTFDCWPFTIDSVGGWGKKGWVQQSRVEFQVREAGAVMDSEWEL